MPEAAWNFQWRYNFFLTAGTPVNYEEIPVAETDDGPTRQQVAQYNAVVLQMRTERDARERQRQEAEAKAKATFLALLSEENRQRYTSAQHVIVKGSAGGIYRIDYGYSCNVKSLHPSGWVRNSYCAYPRGMQDHEGRPLPYHDAMIAQMLMLVTDERRFLDTAY